MLDFQGLLGDSLQQRMTALDSYQQIFMSGVGLASDAPAVAGLEISGAAAAWNGAVLLVASCDRIQRDRFVKLH